MKYRLLSFTIFFFISSFKQAGAQTDTDLETIRNRFIQEILDKPVDEAKVAKAIKTLDTNGSWPDINYQDVSRTGFENRVHLENMVEMSRAYKKEGNPYTGNPPLKQAILKALDYWLQNDFICDNWWWNQIGTPERMVHLLLLMDNELSTAQLIKADTIAFRANLDAWGARPGGDRIKIAGILGKYALHSKDAKILQDVIHTMAEEIHIATGRGLQADMSFHHRTDRVTCTLTYGLGYAEAFADWAEKVRGTSYQFPEKALQLLIDFYLDGICQTMAFGKYPDPTSKNRGITRKGALGPLSPEIPEKLSTASPHRKEELLTIVKIRKGEIQPNITGSRHYWHSDFFSHQRPGYFTSVRMYSSRNHSVEQPHNSEGIKNHHLADGANFIIRTGKEYQDIFPVYDWQKIPGTTVLQKPALPDPEKIQQKGRTDFVGGVTDGIYGIAAFDMYSPLDATVAKKAWFMFGDQYVCLGAGIQSSAVLPVVTTLNQCYLKGDVILQSANRVKILEKAEQPLTRVNWLWHDSVGYLFPRPTDIGLSNTFATGSWRSINQQSVYTEEKISHEVFKLWIDHGVAPQDAGYAYIVFPGIQSADLEGYLKKPTLEIIANRSNLQAVWHKEVQMYQVVFYQPGSVQLAEGLRLSMENAGLVMIQLSGKSIKKITVADPSQKLQAFNFQITKRFRPVKSADYTVNWNAGRKQSDVYVRLPQAEWAGKSVVMEWDW